jgi:hypothetical protein
MMAALASRRKPVVETFTENVSRVVLHALA